MDTENRLERIRAAIEQLAPPVHACTLYSRREEEVAMAVANVRAGLRNGDRCICVVDDGGETIRNALASEDVDVDAEAREGRLVFFQWPHTGNLRARDMVGQIEQWAKDAQDAGCAGCRITGEMTWALGDNLNELAEFESRLDHIRVWERHVCSGLCQFDVSRFTPGMLREMIVVHPVVVIGDRVCRNPYYVPPEQYLSPDWPQREADWMITNLEQLEAARDNLRASEESYRALARRLVNLQEKERRGIARELHDQVGQSLTAIRINMDIIRAHASDQGDAKTRARADDSIRLIESTFKSVQDVMYDLRPPMLDELGLVASLRWYSRHFTERTGIHVEIHGSEDCRCGVEVETAFFRIAQEALTNVARHSQARKVRIELRDSDEETALTVEDDGIGFPTPRDRAAKAGYGLVTMRERAEALGGAFERTSEGHGTRITVTVPRTRLSG